VFSTAGRVLDIKHPSKAGVENAFRGINAGGGTSHESAIYAAVAHSKKPASDEDVVMIWIGDEGERRGCEAAIRASGLNPVAFGLLRLPGENFNAVTSTAAGLGIPCFPIDEKIFQDPYAIPRTMRNLIAATPAAKISVATRAPTRETIVQTILKTPLLKKPVWAAAV
jgi:hypothetical protein